MSVPAHIPVLAERITALLSENRPSVCVDCTLGLGGHAELLLQALPGLRLIGIDIDEINLARAQARLATFAERIQLFRASFADLASRLREIGITKVDAILADLGLSSNQLEDPARGFSFEVDAPLDMRLDRAAGPTAADLVNTLSEGELADLLYLQSQERHSRRIAKRICQARRQGRINSTVMLARLVSAAVGENPDSPRARIHPATRTFMALRMTVNHEADALRRLLLAAPGLLQPRGRIAVISFHSGEDRLVKEDFRARSNAGEYRLVTKKPVTADDAERASNPRSRSAKLRVAERRDGP